MGEKGWAKLFRREGAKNSQHYFLNPEYAPGRREGGMGRLGRLMYVGELLREEKRQEGNVELGSKKIKGLKSTFSYLFLFSVLEKRVWQR